MPECLTLVKRILITPGEPAGIGPDITLQLIQNPFPHQLISIADPDMMRTRADMLGLPVTINIVDLDAANEKHQPGVLNIVPVPLVGKVTPGKLNPQHANYVLETLKTAAKLCVDKKADGLATGPVHKGVINDAGIPFSGHTEFFAQVCGVPLTVMFFVVDDLKVALLTTHLPLKDVSKAITNERIEATIHILQNALQTQFGLATPRILVCGLNPHAGENGHLGREEIDVIAPTLERLRKTRGYHLRGPLPADTIFTPQQLATGDAVLAMYHDQALPLVKYLGFDHAVNVTLGLPFIRTSVDHGTALDIAGTGKANIGSLVAAIALIAGTSPTK